MISAILRRFTAPRPLLGLLLAVFCGFTPLQLRAESAPDHLQQVKAAFIYNIAKFVSWPEQQDKQQLLLCYFRSNPQKQGFTLIADKQVHNLTLQGKEIANMAQATDCDILFIPEQQLFQFHAESWVAPSLALLTIADLTGFKDKRLHASGAIVNLIRKNASIGLEVDLKQARQTPLQISSELMKIARIRR